MLVVLVLLLQEMQHRRELHTAGAGQGEAGTG
jgi:hypothetical protein